VNSVRMNPSDGCYPENVGGTEQESSGRKALRSGMKRQAAKSRLRILMNWHGSRLAKIPVTGALLKNGIL